MIVDVEIRERLSHFCLVTKLTQEKAANLALREVGYGLYFFAVNP